MPNHKKPVEEKVHAICGTCKIGVKEYIVEHAKAKEVSIGAMVGMILTEWVEGMQERFPGRFSKDRQTLLGMKG